MSSSLKAVALLATVAVLSAQCGGGGGAARGPAGGISPANSSIAPTAKIDIKDYKYVPETLHVKVGSVVRWTNFDNVGHTVTFTAADTARRPIRSRAEALELNRPSQLYSSRLFDDGETFTVRFDQAGRFGYICDPHPYMKAVVIVE